MLGYWNRPEESAKALRDGWLYTGDMARRDADEEALLDAAFEDAPPDLPRLQEREAGRGSRTRRSGRP